MIDHSSPAREGAGSVTRKRSVAWEKGTVTPADVTDATVMPLPPAALVRSSHKSPSPSCRNLTVIVASPVIASDWSPIARRNT